MDDGHAKFAERVMPHLDAAYRLAVALTRSRVDAEDVVQEAMLRAFRSIDTLRDGESCGWLLAIVRNCFLTGRARLRKRAAISAPEEEERMANAPIDSAEQPENLSLGGERRRMLSGLIANLSEEHREILVLREVEDLSYREIADLAAVPIGTVMSRLARARSALRALWIAEYGAAPP